MSAHSGRVLVIGGGAMGTGIAARLSAAGIETVVLVRRPEAAATTRDEISRRVEHLVELGTAPPESVRAATVLVGEAPGPFALAVESIAEDMAAKRVALALAESLVLDDGIVATNTSSLRLADLANGLKRPELFAGWHWFNPAELVPLVEVTGGPRTAPETLERLAALSRAVGKEPITLLRDHAGFVANRLQYALLREAYALVEEGVCAVADVDRAVVAGLGARWAAIGPFASMDAAGLDVHEAVAEQLFPQLSRSTEVPALLREARRSGATGMKGGRGLLGDYPPGSGREIAARRDTVLALLAEDRREAEL
ncbi:3-hydroxyacyl-CoA dehydrogenase family protein [Streptomyces sp. NBC_00620]|uniref:3-hydroxyacyl-CoA dehydrogenase family protein n=1 Tax=unclassified Streptomyces TaxID=2593676 RepID=UPI002254BA1A|nr:3-hydroxyacyl-CoA dehydrogenase NAD-binding domain-containing protein [Streptomyces sp. NBC_00620]MCX4976855.1 3-hydroxyacyl-CoA dehydrogenase NAD-binding domain-containing protein [Streptomyces sp. NBC_00620]WUC09074.1 3-hydroxyacyl-CoA dehydrogenase NAD-binding domain-containing protein [Streptomyces sp. NBC_00564]